tara:strand:- start:104782 stop:105738 length:957 start_codon:yes stop_codon:yes gene_type:complete
MIDVQGRPTGGGLVSLALPIVLSVGLFYASGFISPLGMLAPAPIFYALIKHGKRIGFVITIVSTLLLLVFGGPLFSVFYLIFCGLTAWIMSETIKREATLEATIGLSALAPFVASIIFFSLIGSGAQIGLNESLTNWASLAVDSVIQSYNASGSDPRMTIWLEDNSKVVVQTFVNIFYGISFLSAIVTVVVNYIVIKTLSMRFDWGISFPDHNFANWSAPDTMVWGIIGGGFVALLDDGMAGVLGINLAIISVAIYFFHGIAITHYYFRKTGFPNIFRAIGYFFIFTQPIIILIVSFVGLTDLWFDYRKLLPVKKGEN